MAPFKLKFRMGGGSRSTSSEHEADTNSSGQGTQSVINSTTSLIHFGSTSTIDSDHNTDSLVSLGNSDQRALLQNCGQTSTDSIGNVLFPFFMFLKSSCFFCSKWYFFYFFFTSEAKFSFFIQNCLNLKKGCKTKYCLDMHYCFEIF